MGIISPATTDTSIIDRTCTTLAAIMGTHEVREALEA